MNAVFALATYHNNQTEDVDDDTVDAFVRLIDDQGDEVRSAAQDAGADVLAGAVNRLGVALRVAGRVRWEGGSDEAAFSGPAAE